MTTVYVGNLDHDITVDELRKEFDRYGKLKDVWLARKPPGFSFLEYYDHRDAQDAVKDMDGRYLLDKKLRCEISRRGGTGPAPRERGPPPRSEHRIKISNLGNDVTWKNLKENLKNDSDPIYVDIRDRGTGIVEFSTASDVDIIIEKYDNQTLCGQLVNIRRSDSPDTRYPPRETDLVTNTRKDDRYRGAEDAGRDRGGRDRSPYRGSGGYGRDRDRDRDRDRRDKDRDRSRSRDRGRDRSRDRGARRDRDRDRSRSRDRSDSRDRKR